MSDATDRVVETLRKFNEADRRLKDSPRSGSDRDEKARDYVRSRRDHQAAIENVESEMEEAGEL